VFNIILNIQTKISFFRTNWFEAVQREYKLVTTKVGIIDLTPFAKFVVKGKPISKLKHY
jgi:glycine cleavage system aminomethyltransferase T